jgi:hypothetical protein
MMTIFSQTLIMATFIASALSKARDPSRFAHTVERFKLVPPNQVGTVARALLGCEALVVVLLAIGFAVPGLVTAGLVVALGLLMVYTAGLAAVRIRGLSVACNCFGASNRPVSWYDVARNILLAGVSIAGLAAAPVSLSAMDTVLVGMVALGAALIVANLANVVETVVKPE